MADYTPLTLSEVAFGLGFGVAMLWPLFLGLALVGAVGAIKGLHKKTWATVSVLNILPLLIAAVFAWAIDRDVDIGPRDGLLAKALENFSMLAFIAGPLFAVLLGVVWLVRLSVSKRSFHAHS